MSLYARLAELVARHGAAALVRVASVKGSAPREEGAAMAVRPDGAFHGTIGGGELEWRALAEARAALAAGRGPLRRLDMALGPDLGQCCGGRAIVTIETFDGRDGPVLEHVARLAEEGRAIRATIGPDGRVQRSPAPEGRVAAPQEPTGGAVAGVAPNSTRPHPPELRSVDLPSGEVEIWLENTGPAPTPLILYGAGHVGRALALALAPLPFRVSWVDTRADAFPAHVPTNATCLHTDEPGRIVAEAAAGAFVLVMTHSHPLDLALTARALARDDLPFVGLIGSATKRARFEKRFREIGLAEARIAALACPIGVPGIDGKEPAVIAASVAAHLLQARAAALSGRHP